MENVKYKRNNDLQTKYDFDELLVGSLDNPDSPRILWFIYWFSSFWSWEFFFTPWPLRTREIRVLQ